MEKMAQERGSSSHSPSGTSPLNCEDRGIRLIQLLILCAVHIAQDSIDEAHSCLDEISKLASRYGDSMQRIALFLYEAFAQRLLKLQGLYNQLNCRWTPSVSEAISARKFFFHCCPFVKAAVLVTNQAIIEAMKGAKVVHIIDLNAEEPAQWFPLLHEFSIRPEGAPHLKITGVHEQKQVLEQVGFHLRKQAEKLDMALQFNSVVTKLEDLEVESLGVNVGEAVAISSILQLHSLLASDGDDHGKSSASPDSVSPSPTKGKMESFLNDLSGLSPKIMVVMEKESDNNSFNLKDRVKNLLHFYAPLFDCLQSTMPTDAFERIMIEGMLFGTEIKNIIACEGLERKERHERLPRWIRRLGDSSFQMVPLSWKGLLQAKELLQMYGRDIYKIREDCGGLQICWQDQAIFSVSCWSKKR